MQQFWDARAREDAYYFVDNRLDYRHPDVERFWAEGEVDLDRVLDSVRARIEPSDAVVDIGCGLGRLTRAIAARAGSVTGIDVSEEMLTRARQLNAGLENVTWVHGNGTDLAGIVDASADACVSHVVFQHIPDPNVTLGYVREIGRVLRPGGWAAFQISNDASVHRRRRRVGARLRSIVGRAPRGQENPSWLGSPIDLAELRSVSDGSGLDVEDVVGAGTQYCLVLVRRR
jgi:SAM-dependent methyltransferase